MNYYERHLGDYARDTGHLTMVEHGAYSLLMDRYYATEQGIPADQAYRLARARTRDERDAVDTVLREFFTLEDGVWRKGRIEEEIAKANKRIEAAKANGGKGGRPRKQNPDETQQKPSGLLTGSDLETQTKALHTPDTNLQEKAEAKADARPAKRGTRLPLDWAPDDELREWASTDHPLIDITAETAKFRDYWAAKAGAGGVKLDWPATWRNWIRNARPTGNRYAENRRSPAESLAERAERKLREGDERERRQSSELF